MEAVRYDAYDTYYAHGAFTQLAEQRGNYMSYNGSPQDRGTRTAGFDQAPA